MIRGLNKITASAGLGYVMSSYTAHEGLEEAAVDAKQIAADLMIAGLVVFVPIAYGPGIEKFMLRSRPFEKEYIQSHEFWMPIDERFFRKCDYGIVATTHGWHRSTGIAIEIGALVEAGKPIWFYDVENEAILTLKEGGDKWPDEMGELIELAAQKCGNHLNSDSSIYSKALAETLADVMEFEH